MAECWSARTAQTAPWLRWRWCRDVRAARSVASAGRAGERAQPPSARNYQATDVTKARSRRSAPAAHAFDGRNRRVEPPDPAEDGTCAWSAWPDSEAHAVVRIHRALARQIADLLAQGAGSCGIFVGRFLPKGKFRLRFDRLPRDLLGVGEFWLAAQARNRR